MKQDRNKRIRILSQKIYKLEQEISQGKNVKTNQEKIENIMSTLSFAEVIELDNYIHKKLLTK